MLMACGCAASTLTATYMTVPAVAGHSLNAIGPAMYPYNIVVFALGTLAFLMWAIRAGNRPQMAVNFVSIAIGIVGLISAFLLKN